MKNIIFIVCGVLLLCLSCRKEIDYESTSFIFPSTKGYIQTSIAGIVVDENNSPLLHAKVTIGDNIILTDLNGVFQFKNVLVDSYNVYIKVEQTGYFHGSRSIIIQAGTRNTVKIQLLAKSNLKLIGTGQQLISIKYNDYSIDLFGNGIEYENGDPFSGSIEVYTKWLDPTDKNFGDKMPGRLLGTGADGSLTGLVSMGMLAIEFKDGFGKVLKFKEGFEATLKMRVPASLISKAPLTIPLWYFDEINGIWKEDGSATLVNDFYVAKVKHFTFWNCDYKAPLVECKFKVKDKNNKPIIGAKVFTKLINSTLYGTGYTDSKGQIIGLIPKDELLNLTVTLPYSQCQNPSYDKVIGPFSQNDSLDIVIDDPGLYYYTIKGNLLNCDFKPITNGYLMITGFSDLILTDDQGNFETTLITCGPQLNAQVNIKGFDTDNFKASQEYVLNVISGNTTNAGIIQVCTAISDYISYSFNGDTYIYTDPKITGNTNNWLLINRKHLNNSIGINIEIINFNGLGNSTIDQIDATGEAKNGVYIVHGCEYGKSFCNDLTANITEFNGPGGYVSGTYSGMVADSTINPVTPIMITGTFRSKWNK